jgi:4-hydroxybenzoate polyprenyltransferase
MGALMGWAAITGQLAWPALLLYMAGIAWTVGYDTIYAFQDREDDAVIGIKSTALKFGEDSLRYISMLYAATAFFILQAGAFMQAGPYFYAVWGIASLHLVWQLYAWKREDAASSLKIFRSNRDFGILILIALALAYLPG